MAHTGAAFWQYTYISGRDDENQVLFTDSTWNDIIKPAAAEVVGLVQSRPPVANCIPGDPFQQHWQHSVSSTAVVLLHSCLSYCGLLACF